MANVVEAIWNLLFKEGEQAKYQENPQEYLQETGLDECDPTELYEAVVMAYEKGPVYQGASVNVGGNQGVGGSSQSAGGASPAAPSAKPRTAVVPPWKRPCFAFRASRSSSGSKFLTTLVRTCRPRNDWSVSTPMPQAFR